jgi:hypothetical protein
VPVEEVPWELPDDDPAELDWVELVEPDCVLDVELLEVEPAWVEPVLVEDWVPVADVVDVASNPPALLVVLPVVSLGAGAAGPRTVEIPPVADADTITVVVVVVVDSGRRFGEAEDVEPGCPESPVSAASFECVTEPTAGADAIGAVAFESVATAGADGATGGRHRGRVATCA